MTEKQMFRAIVRGFGVYFGAYGSEQLWILVARLFLFSDAQYRFSEMQDFLYTLFVFALSYLLIRKTDLITNIAYESDSEPDRLPD